MSETCKTKISVQAKQRFLEGKLPQLRKGIPKGQAHPMLGKSHSVTTKAKMRAKKLGKPLSKTHIANRTKAQQRAVICVETGAIFESAKLAAATIGIKSPGNITLVCQNKKKTAGGYSWKYLNT